MENQEIISDPVVEKESVSFYKKPKIIGLFVLILALALGLGAFAFVSINEQKNTEEKNLGNTEEAFLADGSVVYGYWKGGNSVISAVDLANGRNKILAVLPTNSKHIKILSGNIFSYIGDTDEFDYGKRLMLHTIEPVSDASIFEADEGFGIDDYVLSPNGELVALWVVGKPDGGDMLLGNKSRVYTLNIKTGENNIIYDEQSLPSSPVHYPVGITNSGEVYLDTFLPNSGAGWGYGMSVSDFKGTLKENIQSMQNGTYSTQPVMSSDGTYFAFAGYDGLDGAVKVDTFRKALINPNTVELLSVENKERIVVQQSTLGTLYPLVTWDQLEGNLLISSATNTEDGILDEQYIYKPSTQLLEKVDNFSSETRFLSSLKDGKLLIGQNFQGDSGTGNLGAYYSNSLNQIMVTDPLMNSTNIVSLDQSPIQLIAVKSSRFFPLLLDSKNLLSDASIKQLQLQTFELKPTLAQMREERQSNPEIPDQTQIPPTCRKIGYPQCNALLGTNYPFDRKGYDESFKDEEFQKCLRSIDTSAVKNHCMDSPLYLYGDKSMVVKVYIGTEITNPNVLVNNNLIQATFDGENKILVDDKSVESIGFDYISRVKKLERPSYGYVVKGKEIQGRVHEVATRLSLNAKEIRDLLDFSSKINSEYVFVSFFDHNHSHDILPLYFDPKPDNYRNVVFYFEKLEKNPIWSVNPPIIDPIERSGFTAIEISYIVR